MGRAFGLVAAISSLAIVAVLMALSMQKNGPSSQSAKRAEAQASAAVGSINFTQAAAELEAFRAEHGTYGGAVLPASFGVTLARADAAGYCLQNGAGGSMQHFAGPGGSPASGPC
jgi:hypothetical protein